MDNEQQSNIPLITVLKKYRNEQIGADEVFKEIEKWKSKISKNEYDRLCQLFREARYYISYIQYYNDEWSQNEWCTILAKHAFDAMVNYVESLGVIK